MSVLKHRRMFIALTVVTLIASVTAVVSRSPEVRFVAHPARNPAGDRILHCELQNRGTQSIELWVHSSTGQPSFRRLHQLGGRWIQMVEYGMCGIDIEHRILGPGETLLFDARHVDSDSPLRLEVAYREGSKDRSVWTRPIPPTVFPPLFGSFWEGTVFPAVLFIPSWLGQVFAWNLDDTLWGFIYFILPIIVMTALVFAFWSGRGFLRSGHEKHAT